MNTIAYVCWQIWKISCEMVLERKCVSIDKAIVRINGAINEFYRLKRGLVKKGKENGKRTNTRMDIWIKLEIGWLKVNCDRALDLKTKIVGFWVIIRNSDGMVVDGVGRKRLVDNALMAKTLALKDGIKSCY